MNDTRTDRRRLGINRMLAGPTILIRQLRSAPAVVVSLMAVILITSVFVAATPQLFNKMAEEGLRHAVRDASPLLRNMTFIHSSIIPGVQGDTFAAVEQEGAAFRDTEMSPRIGQLVTNETFVLDSPVFLTSPMPGEAGWPFTVFLHMRYQQDVTDHIRVVAGRLPQPRDSILLDAEGIGTGGNTERVEVFEIAVSASTSDEMEIGVGERFIAMPDPFDFAYRQGPHGRLDYRIVIEVAGIIEPLDETDEYWFADPELLRPRLVANPDFVLVFPTGLISPDDYERWLHRTSGGLWRYSWRYFVDPERVDAASVGELAADLRKLEVDHRPIGSDGAGFKSGLSGLVHRYNEQRASTVAMLSFVTLGLFTVAGAVAALLSALLAAYHRDSFQLVRSRGASRRQLTMWRLAEGLILSVPATVVGLVATYLFVPGSAAGLSWRLTLLLVFAFTAFTVAVALPGIRRDAGPSDRDGARIVQKRSPVRAVTESLVVILAAFSVFELRRRGVAVDDAIEDVAEGLDLLLVAAPVLVAVAVGIVTLRLYPYVIRLFAWGAAKQRSVVPFVGLRRILQQPSAVGVGLVAVVLAAGIGMYAATIRSSIAAGQSRSTWQQAGADFRVNGLSEKDQLPAGLDISEVEAVAASAYGVRLDAFPRPRVGLNDVVDILALDSTSYAKVTAGTGADARFPNDFATGHEAGAIGSDTNPIPAIVEQGWAEARSLLVGDHFVVSLGSTEPVFVVAETRIRFPGLALDRPFIVADLDNIEVAGGVERRPTVLYLRAPESAADDIEATLRTQAPNSVVTSRSALRDDLRRAPLVAGVVDGYGVAFWLSVAFAMMAVAGAFVLTAASRARDLSYLRAMGLSVDQARRITLLEQLPQAVIAAAVGGMLGVGLAVLFEPGIDLAAFTGNDFGAALRIDAIGIAVAVIAVTVAVAGAVLFSSLLGREESVGSILRLGGE